MLVNPGIDSSLPEEKWKDLADRIEAIVTGQNPLFACTREIGEFGVRHARRSQDRFELFHKKSMMPFISRTIRAKPSRRLVTICSASTTPHRLVRRLLYSVLFPGS
jgi:hypothetical protein